MEIPTKKLKCGFELQTLALGTWGMGGAYESEKGSYKNEEKDIKAIRHAYETGLRRFDTAELYAGGYSEEILGKALKNYDRSEIFITSKVWSENLRYDDVLKSAEGSLRRLGIDYLDLYLLHRPNQDVSIKETMGALAKLKSGGLIKNIGVSNLSKMAFIEAQNSISEKIVLNQVHYNLTFRESVEDGLLDYCQKNDVFFEAWRAIEKGGLTKAGIKILDEMARKYGKTPAQVAINWLISQKNVVAVFKTSDIKHLEENLGGVGWTLDESDIRDLTKKFPVEPT